MTITPTHKLFYKALIEVKHGNLQHIITKKKEKPTGNPYLTLLIFPGT